MLTIFALLALIVAILAAAIAVCIWAAIAVCIWAAVVGLKLLFWVAPVLLVIAILLIVFVIGGLV